MSLIGFPISAAQPLCAAAFEALAPTLGRMRRALGSIAPLSSLLRSPLAAAFKRLQATAAQPAYKAVARSRLVHVVRVVRESDASISADCAGRMVISGRMADVCAELDRMALRAGTATGKR